MTPAEAEACCTYLAEAHGSPERWALLIKEEGATAGENAWQRFTLISRADPAAVSDWIDSCCSDAGRRRVLAAVRQKRFTTASPLVTTKLTSETHSGLIQLANANGLTLDETVGRLVRAAAKLPAVARELSPTSAK